MGVEEGSELGSSVFDGVGGGAAWCVLDRSGVGEGFCEEWEHGIEHGGIDGGCCVVVKVDCVLGRGHVEIV